MKDLQSRVQTLTIENESLNATIEDLEVRSQEALKKLHAELSNVNRQYTTYEEMSQSLQEVNEELRVKLETTTEDGRKLQQKMSEVQRERDQLLADVEMARDKQAILEQSVKELSETVANLQLHQAYIKGASSTAIHEPSAEEKMARIEREFREIKEHDAKLDAENERLRVRNEKLARDVDLMAHKNRKTTELGEKLVAEVEARRAEVNTLRTLMQQLREQNETLSARINMGSEEAEFVKRQLSEAFGLLKTSSAEDEPMRENELDVDDEDEDEERMALTNNRK